MSTVEQIEADRLLAEAIARGEEVSGPEPALQVYTRAEEPVAPTAPVTPVKRGFFSSFSRRGHSTSPERYSQGNSVDQLDELESSMAPVEQMSGENRNDDAFLARAMQMMEFEMEHDMRRDDELADDFNNKEFRGSSCKSQLLTVSTFLVIVQIAILWAMIEVDGLASNSVNPMYGPKPETLVKWGAKEAALIKYRKEYWRLVSPIMLHAGIIHMVTNGIIQLRIGGYLNIVWGTPKFLLIYLLSGMFGNVASCIFLPDTIGVGASGSLLGILSAWLVWIIFRWKKIPENNRTQRNCQLLIV